MFWYGRSLSVFVFLVWEEGKGQHIVVSWIFSVHSFVWICLLCRVVVFLGILYLVMFVSVYNSHLRHYAPVWNIKFILTYLYVICKMIYLLKHSQTHYNVNKIDGMLTETFTDSFTIPITEKQVQVSARLTKKDLMCNS